MATAKNMKHRRRIRHEEALERQAVRDTRSNKEQLQVLDRRLGQDIGAVKERARLSKNGDE